MTTLSVFAAVRSAARIVYDDLAGVAGVALLLAGLLLADAVTAQLLRGDENTSVRFSLLPSLGLVSAPNVTLRTDPEIEVGSEVFAIRDLKVEGAGEEEENLVARLADAAFAWLQICVVWSAAASAASGFGFALDRMRDAAARIGAYVLVLELAVAAFLFGAPHVLAAVPNDVVHDVLLVGCVVSLLPFWLFYVSALAHVADGRGPLEAMRRSAALVVQAPARTLALHALAIMAAILGLLLGPAVLVTMFVYPVAVLLFVRAAEGGEAPASLPDALHQNG